MTDRVEPVVDEVVVNCHPRQRDRMNEIFEHEAVTLAVDDRPGACPLAGIRRGLDAATGERAVVVACDMPLVDRTFVEFLFERAARVEAAIPRQAGGWYQPLQAVYAVGPFLSAIDADIDRPIEPALDLEHVIVWDPGSVAGSADTFYNVNTPEDLDGAAAALG